MPAASYPSNTSAQKVGSLVVGAGNESDAHAEADDVVVGDLASADSGVTVLASPSGEAHFAATDTAGSTIFDLVYRFTGQNCRMQIEGTEIYQFSANDFLPIADGARDLGIASFRWNSVYSEKYSLRTPSGFAGEEVEWQTYHVSTTDGSNNDTTIATVDTNQRSLIYSIYVMGERDTGDNVYGYHLTTGLHRTGGALTGLGGAILTGTQNNGTGSTVSASAIFTGDNLGVRVAGNVSENWEWNIIVMKQEGGFTS